MPNFNHNTTPPTAIGLGAAPTESAPEVLATSPAFAPTESAPSALEVPVEQPTEDPPVQIGAEEEEQE